ncbi:MAG: competence/damage-inducible protein A [Calditrichaeota bacterium]|nr:MAG: competence/damage-inducible protein A [Calditrichota bacterium]
MQVEILTIGDEIITGHIDNTNASYLARQLTALGLDVKWLTAVGDQASDLRAALDLALTRAQVVIATGGLGPTHDDITKKVAAEYFNSSFVFVPEILQKIKAAFEARGRPMPKVNEDQAMVPEKARIIENPVGSAPGFWFEKDGKKCFFLPGVPAEMKAMCEQTVFPLLKSYGQPRREKIIRTIGIPESTLFEQIDNFKNLERLVKIAFLPRSGGVDIRLIATAENEEECERKLNQAVQYLQQKFSKNIYGYDEQELEDVVAQLLFQLKKTVAVAESCTGGLLAHKLTNISGSSDYFERGVVSYSNQAKMDILGVRAETLQKFGAVSEQTAVEMAQGVRKISRTDFGLSTTGIAGPTGGTPEKPVGLVYVGFADAHGAYAKRYHFFKDRLLNKNRAVMAALNILRKELLKLRHNTD